MAEENFKRSPARESLLDDFGKFPGRMALTGVLRDLKQDYLKAGIEWDAKKVDIAFKDAAQKHGMVNGMNLRVIGKPIDNVFEVETVHELKNFNFRLLERIKKLERMQGE